MLFWKSKLSGFWIVLPYAKAFLCAALKHNSKWTPTLEWHVVRANNKLCHKTSDIRYIYIYDIYSHDHWLYNISYQIIILVILIPIGSMVLLYMVTWISIYPSHVSINIPAPWIRHGITTEVIIDDIGSSDPGQTNKGPRISRESRRRGEGQHTFTLWLWLT